MRAAESVLFLILSISPIELDTTKQGADQLLPTQQRAAAIEHIQIVAQSILLNFIITFLSSCVIHFLVVVVYNNSTVIVYQSENDCPCFHYVFRFPCGRNTRRADNYLIVGIILLEGKYSANPVHKINSSPFPLGTLTLYHTCIDLSNGF